MAGAALGFFDVSALDPGTSEFWFMDLLPGDYELLEILPLDSHVMPSVPDPVVPIPLTVLSGQAIVWNAGSAGPLEPGQEEVPLEGPSGEASLVCEEGTAIRIVIA